MDSSDWLDRASDSAAADWLLGCCESTHWVDRMLAQRPFRNLDRLHQAAREEWFALAPADWKRAFAHHPRIGDRDAWMKKFAAAEQAGVREATADIVDGLIDGNRAYEAKFGYIFIICATGKSANEMLAQLRERLKNDPATELRLAAEEHARITELRLSNSPPESGP